MTSGQWDMIAMEALEREALEQYTVQEFPVRAFSPPRHPPPPPLSSSSSLSSAAAAAATNITATHAGGGGIIDASPYAGAYLRQSLHNMGGPPHQIVQQQLSQQPFPSPVLLAGESTAVPPPPPTTTTTSQHHHPSHNCPLNPHHHEMLLQQQQQQQHRHPRYTASAAVVAATATAAAAAPTVGHCRAEHHHLGVGGDGTTTTTAAAVSEHLDEELEDHIKHCTCTCNHMGYGNFMDYQTTCFSGLPDVTEPSNHLQHHHQKFATAAAMATPQQFPATIAGEPLHSYHHHQHHHQQHQQHHQQHHHHHPHNIGSNHHPAAYPAKHKASCREAGGYLVDFMHSCNKAPPSPGRASPSTSLSRHTPDDIISAKSDTDLSGDKKDFGRRQSSSGGGGGGGRFRRRRSGHHGGGSDSDCMGLPCVSCSLCVAIVAVLVLLGLAVALSVADVDVVAGWFGGGRGGPKSNELRMRVVRRVLQQTPLIDGHNDLPWNIRRYAHNRLENFSFATGLHNVVPWNSSMWSRTDWPRLRAGLVGAQFWSAYVPCAAQGQDAVQVALEQIDLIHRFIDWNAPRMQLVRSAQDIIDTHRDGRLASLIGVEGGHALGSSLSVLRAMYTLGVRYMTLTYTCDTPWASSSTAATITTTTTTTTSTLSATDIPATAASASSHTPPSHSPPPRGLSSFGKLVVREMNRLGMMIDLAHSSDATVRDVLAESRAPVIFSHSAARALCNSTRNVNDETLRDVATNGGIVMVSFDAAQVACSAGGVGGGGSGLGSAAARRSAAYGTAAGGATIADVIAHINYVRAIAGVGHIGIGAGFDGIASVPAGLEDVSTYPRLFAELLRDPRWTEADLHLLAGQNLLRVLHSVENTRDYMAKLSEAPAETKVPRAAGACTSKSL